jgi:hypothetical protein
VKNHSICYPFHQKSDAKYQISKFYYFSFVIFENALRENNCKQTNGINWLNLVTVCAFRPVLPDGIFSNQKSQFVYILEGLAMEDVGIFRAILFYLTAKWYIFWPFVTLCGHLVLFFHILVCCTKKNL